jgi:LmbE family N-acetylglucosaminyl deacetylase
MPSPLKLTCVLAHPDDESLGFGGVLAKYAAEGVEIHVITATRGERGRYKDAATPRPPNDDVGREREGELREAASILGVHEVSVLGYPDGAVHQAGAADAQRAIAAHLRRVRPDVVLTFGPDGAYGHPDHIAICQLATAATLRAAYESDRNRPHQISKLYYLAWSADKWQAYQSVFGDLRSVVHGVERRAVPWPDWIITTVIETGAFWGVVRKAVRAHGTQMAIYRGLDELPEERHRALWERYEFYRTFSLAPSPLVRESDLFAGLR